MGAFDEALRDAIDARGISVAQLTRECKRLGTPISTATLSYWLSGQTKPGRRSTLDVVRSIEHILRLAPGDLFQLLAGFQEVERVPKAESVAIVPRYDALRDLRERWGFPSDDGLHRSQLVSTYDVTPEKAVNNLRLVLTAQRNGIEKFIIAFDHLHEDDRFEVVHGARNSRTEKYDEDGIAYELTFPRPLKRGELAIVEVRYTNARHGDYKDQYDLFVVHPADFVTLSVRFHDMELPAEVTRTLNHLDATGAMVTRRRQIPLKGNTVQATLADVSIGHVQIAWPADPSPRPAVATEYAQLP